MRPLGCPPEELAAKADGRATPDRVVSVPHVRGCTGGEDRHGAPATSAVALVLEIRLFLPLIRVVWVRHHRPRPSVSSRPRWHPPQPVQKRSAKNEGESGLGRCLLSHRDAGHLAWLGVSWVSRGRNVAGGMV